MKAIRIVSVILVISAFFCSFISCDQTSGADVSLPEREFYEITVSFQIKNAAGEIRVDAKDYKYKSHAEPTVLNVVDHYLSVVQDWVCKVDKTNTLTHIGGMKVSKNDGEYWGFVTNVVENAETGELTLKETSAINLSVEQIKKNLSDGKMSDTLLIDGAEFTVMMITQN